MATRYRRRRIPDTAYQPSAKKITKRQGWARRYWRYVEGRVHILEGSSLARGKSHGELVKIAREDLRPLFIEYAAARKVSYDLFNSPRMRKKVMDTATTESGKRSALRQAIRIARADQARLRAEITRSTGIGLMSLMSAEEKTVGESIIFAVPLGLLTLLVPHLHLLVH